MSIRRRRTYVISVRDETGPATVEEVHSGRVARLDSFAEAPAQIRRWLRDHAMPASPQPRKAGPR